MSVLNWHTKSGASRRFLKTADLRKPMKKQWQDETRNGVVVASRLKLRSLEMSIHHHMDYPASAWLLTCHQIDLTRNELGDGIGLEAAKKIAIARVMAHVNAFREDLEPYSTPPRK